MCGRYALSLRPSLVRQHLASQNMPADEAPDDEDEQLRQSYNFAPGYHGLIYRAATSDRGTDATPYEDEDVPDDAPPPKKAKVTHAPAVDGLATKETKYKLQAAKWGLIPFWTKRAPDYGSMMRTINCRDDSLIENRGMWNTMKQRKRCIVVAEGFYEWLKKNNGKEKIPHFMKRKDAQLMCFAGLWDCVQYEDSEEKLYTYTIITTDSNKQLKFLHDRMPVILEAGSEAMMAWLSPNNIGWNKELQSMLKPFQGELECYPVDKAVGKVGNNSPSFVVPIDSKENKNNIANFFGNQKKKDTAPVVKEEGEERGTTTKVETSESHAPLPNASQSEEQLDQAIKKEALELGDNDIIEAIDQQTEEGINREASEITDADLVEAASSPPRMVFSPKKSKASPMESSPSKSPATKPTPSKARSATSNGTMPRTPAKEGNKKITSFFGK